MQNIEQRRLDRAYRKALEAGASPDTSPEAALAAAEARDAAGDPYALGGIGRYDPLSMAVKVGT